MLRWAPVNRHSADEIRTKEEQRHTHVPALSATAFGQGNKMRGATAQKYWLCLVLGLCSAYPVWTEKPGLGAIAQWSQLEFDYASNVERQRDVDTGRFIPGAPAPIDMDVYFGQGSVSMVFVTVPRFQAGVPATLGTVSNTKVNGNPAIAPYPSWEWHENPALCAHNRIVSVYRIKVDECGRLWVVDTGRLVDKAVCPPQILAFDLATNQLVHRYEIPADQLEKRSILVTPVVDVRDPHAGCKDTFVYVADCQTFSIIVHDVARGASWQVTDKTMYPYPNFGTYSIQGESFDLMDGVLGMTLSPYQPGKDRILFYHAMSSATENWVFTSDLRNGTRFMHNSESSPEIFHTFEGKRRSQSAAEATDSQGIVYYGTMSDTSINCWNSAYDFTAQSTDVIAQNSKTLQFASGVKVIKNKKGVEEMWVLTSRFQKIATGTLSSAETNFRIQGGKIDDLIFGTKCKRLNAPPPYHSGGYGIYKLHKPPNRGKLSGHY